MALKNIPGILCPDLLWILSAMGHGDELAIVDKNFSACRVSKKTVTGKLVSMNAASATDAIAAILAVMPLDHFVEQPLMHMEDPDQAGTMLPVHADVELLCSTVEKRSIKSRSIERFAYYPLAESCFAVVHTGETRPYGNFILKKGVV
ncbi:MULTISPECIES: RbsD/FucU family protein [Rhizobium]|uniref:RbsD/FucU family protein n=1 Tax=Rhizobium TaxID=379 RepID=UPI000522FF7E|nr:MULTISPECIES: RbsD/FucU domain-containing protein [Rhizobium]KPN26129.1 fucose dissimilation pathway protein FucU [Rhizobium brockwellii]MBY5399888.1 fucose dissimilation pathway protein FucU [Rhizobium leguminosarum]QJX04060.1 fucose dissimilation pathway protein FucU [Rhizobium brockwellii]TAX33441.1 fucose dissimilation pathway protein FucU [Rhizobium leguminosarum]